MPYHLHKETNALSTALHEEREREDKEEIFEAVYYLLTKTSELH